MLKKIRRAGKLSLLAAIPMFSCKTYQIPVDSFKQQFTAAAARSKHNMVVVGPIGEHSAYSTYQMASINAVDKKGTTVTLEVSPSLETRFFYGKGKHVTFYFDMIRFDGDTLDGGQSRFLPSLRKKIPISAVTRIDIQNGGKNFHYKQ